VVLPSVQPRKPHSYQSTLTLTPTKPHWFPLRSPFERLLRS
jgi:hypothetical protein